MRFKLAPIDASFYSFDTETTHQQFGCICLLQGVPNSTLLKQRVDLICKLFPRMTWSVDRDEMLWIDTPDFKVEDHLTIDGECPNGAKDALLDRAAEIFSNRLPMNRPLWRLVLLCPKQLGGEFASALLFTAHHAMTDGIGMREILNAITTPTPETDPNTMRPVYLREVSPEADLSRTTFRSAASLARLVTQMRSPRGTTPLNGDGQLRSARHAGGYSDKPLNSTERKLSGTLFPLSELRRLKQIFSVSINDLLLAITSLGLRRYHLHHGVEPATLRAIMPVSLRHHHARTALGNHLTGVAVSLPLQLSDPVAQPLAIHDEITELEKSGQFGAYALLGELVARLPRSLRRRFAEAQAKRTNLICTNVRFSMSPQYFAGARVMECYGLPALMREHGIAFCYLTQEKTLCLSMISDPAIVSDPENIISALESAFQELCRAADFMAHRHKGSSNSQENQRQITAGQMHSESNARNESALDETRVGNLRN